VAGLSRHSLNNHFKILTCFQLSIDKALLSWEVVVQISPSVVEEEKIFELTFAVTLRRYVMR